MHRGRGFQQRGGVIGRVVRTVPLSLLRFVLLAVAAACGQAVLAGGKYDSVWGPMQYVIDVGSHHVMLNVCGTYRTQVLCKTGMARKSPREIPGGCDRYSVAGVARCVTRPALPAGDAAADGFS